MARTFNSLTVRRITLSVIALIVVAGVLLYVRQQSKTCQKLPVEMVIIDGVELQVSVAATQEQQAQGLGGCKRIPAGQGMYFPYSPPQRVTFWMKDTIIPLDIIWVKNGTIAGIEHDVLPQPGVPETELILYPSPGEVDGVLEVPAGDTEVIFGRS